MANVLDSSAVLAILFEEPGAEVVWPILDGALMTSVNVSEVFRVAQRRGTSFADTLEAFLELPVKVQPFEFEDATATAEFASRFPHLSLGDCACIALARREAAHQVLTTDRVWAIGDFGVKVRLIR
jgi:PIN domain nuclease of toxin-antitoxin system